MGLDISVNGNGYYHHSYSAIHELRLFAAQKEYPSENIGDNNMYYRSYYRFRALIDHSDCEYGYIPNGVQPPYTSEQTDKTWQWPPTEELLRELKDLGQYRIEMDEDVAGMYDELLTAAEASVKEGKPIEFH